MREALAYAKGEADVTKFAIHIPANIDVKKSEKILSRLRSNLQHVLIFL